MTRHLFCRVGIVDIVALGTALFGDRAAALGAKAQPDLAHYVFLTFCGVPLDSQKDHRRRYDCKCWSGEGYHAYGQHGRAYKQYGIASLEFQRYRYFCCDIKRMVRGSVWYVLSSFCVYHYSNSSSQPLYVVVCGDIFGDCWWFIKKV